MGDRVGDREKRRNAVGGGKQVEGGDVSFSLLRWLASLGVWRWALPLPRRLAHTFSNTFFFPFWATGM